MKQQLSKLALYALLGVCMAACRKSEHEPIISSQVIQVTSPVTVADGGICGFFLLNEANMGSNKASLDYFDYRTGKYHRNIYPERNPNVIKELGDVGNDLRIYRDRLYAVLNCSNLVEVMDARTVRSVGSVTIKNCRYIAFDGDYAYVSSFASELNSAPDAPGKVVKVDLNTLKTVGECVVGYQPEEMVITGGKLYVANSGVYRAPGYDKTVSVIDLAGFSEIKKIELGPKLHRMTADNYGNIYISSRPDGPDKPSKTYILDTSDDSVTVLDELPNSGMALAGDMLYIYSIDLDDKTGEKPITYIKWDTASKQVASQSFITDGSEGSISIPYGVAVNADNGEIFVTDSPNFTTPGYLYCYSAEGKLRWSVRTGDIPAHIAFTRKQME